MNFFLSFFLVIPTLYMVAKGDDKQGLYMAILTVIVLGIHDLDLVVMPGMILFCILFLMIMKDR